MSEHPDSFVTRAQAAYARLIVRRPGTILITLIVVFLASLWGTTKLTIDSNQLNLIDQNLPEVKEVKRIIDIVGGNGYLILGLRGADEKQLKQVSDDLNARFQADKANVRFTTYKLPVDFIQKNMVLFIDTKDLIEGKNRINAYLRDQLKRRSPFFFEIVPTKPVELKMDDLFDKYTHIGKKSIRDDYYISDDTKMLIMLIKPTWDSNDLGKTETYLKTLYKSFDDYSATNTRGVKLVQSYDRDTPAAGTISWGLTGSYKMSLDDSYAIAESLQPVTILAFLAIFVITIAFFRKIVPTLIVVSGMVVGTIIAMGFTYVTIGELQMVTSILGGILMGFGVDYGIQFIYRTRIELGTGKPYDEAIRSAIINAGRPASVAAVVTGGSFFVLLVSKFRGFSQFGFLAGFGTMIIGFTLFCWSPAILMLIGRWRPHLVARLIGVTPPPKSMNVGGEIRIPRPKLVLGIAIAVTAVLCAFAIPWTDASYPQGYSPTMFERLKAGVRFNYNTRALLPVEEHSVKLMDEIADRFQISADPVAVFAKDNTEAKEVWEELERRRQKPDSTIEQIVSEYTFVPPPERAAANAKVLEEWQKELADIDTKSLPPEVQDKADFFKAVLAARPYTVDQLPDIYSAQFKWLPETKPENRGVLTFIYPKVDLRDGRLMLKFADEVRDIKAASGKVYHGAGSPLLFAQLAKIVLRDGYVTVILTTIWILFMHYLDFRSVKLALASVIPLGVGLVEMLGIMSITDHQLNFMNIIILPILLGFGVSHGLYLLHRFLEGTSPVVALRSVGAAVAASTLTAIAGFGSLLRAAHYGLKSIGFVACLGLTTTLIVSFTVLAAVLQLIHDGRMESAPADTTHVKHDQPPQLRTG